MEHEIVNEVLKAHILYKLARHRRWGGKHTELVNVRTALPRECQRDAETLARELANDGFLTWLPKTGQIHVSLNPRKKKEIVELVEKYIKVKIW
ncbi:MAG: hypothetical protein WC717_06550 [Candidatus Micrarchaeia archaeon]